MSEFIDIDIVTSQSILSMSALVSATTLINDIFNMDNGTYTQLYTERNNQKGNPIIQYNGEHKNMCPRYSRVLYRDTYKEQLSYHSTHSSYAIMNNCTYFGNKKDKNHIHQCFGITQEIDGLTTETLINFLEQCAEGEILTPNYLTISKSGRGIHAYYLFNKPIDCKWWNTIQLEKIKQSLCDKLWTNKYSNRAKQNNQTFMQSFMLPGFTHGCQYYNTTLTFALQPNHYNIEKIAQFVNHKWLQTNAAKEKYNKYPNAKHSLQYCKKNYPNWYNKKIVGKKTQKYITNPAFYNFLIKKCADNHIQEGHRYKSFCALTAVAIKCNISKKQLKEDLNSLFNHYNITSYSTKFTHEDMHAAIEHYYNPKSALMKRATIEKYIGMPLPPNKRNNKTRVEHLQYARKQANIKTSGNWRKYSNNKNKQNINKWAKTNTKHKKYNRAKCARDLNIDPRTAAKYLKEIELKEHKETLFKKEVQVIKYGKPIKTIPLNTQLISSNIKSTDPPPDNLS